MSESGQNNIESSIPQLSGTGILPIEQTSKGMLQKASAGLALQGMLVSKNEEEILRQRFNLITVQDNIFLTFPSNKGIYDKTEQFTSQVQESTFKKSIEKFGASVKGSAEGNSLFQELVNVTVSASFNKDEEYTAEVKQKIEASYYSKVQYVVVPTAACVLNSNQVRLDHNALQELKRIDTILRNPDSIIIATQACQDFLNRYGSHALVGTITFGGIYLISASCSEFKSVEEQKIQNVVSQKITTQFELNVTGVGGGKLDTSYSSDATSLRTHEQVSMESRIILETTKIGGSAQANDLKDWKDGLIQDSSTWAVIDRDYSGTVAVWDIICRHHVNEFEDAKLLTEMLHKEWIKLSSLETKFWYFVDDMATINEQINLLVTQKIPLWFQNQQITTQNLSYLFELRKEVENKTKDSGYWVQKVLSIKIVQEYLLYFRHNHNVADGKQIKDLMYQLLTTKDAIAMFRKENSQLDYSKLKDILSWLDELPEFIKAHNDVNDVNDVETLINKIDVFIRLIVNKNTSERLSSEEKLCTYLEFAIINLRSKLKQRDELSELYLLGLLLPLGYIPNFNLFKPILKLEDYRKLKTSLKENKDHPLGIEVNGSSIEKREAHLICQILTSGYLDLNKSKIINFINETLQPNLKSPSVLKVLDTYTLGYSPECLEAIKELQNIINDVKNIKEGIDLFALINSPSIPVIESENSTQQPSPVLEKVLEQLELTKYYPDKLGREEVYSITEYSLEQHKPKTKKQLVTHFLSNLISFNYSGRSLKVISEDTLISDLDWGSDGNENSQEQETDLHSLDVVTAIFLCCNPIIRQDFVQRLWGCKLAIPLVIQERSDKAPKFFLWAMRSLVLEWATLQGDKEQEIATYPVETISFIRFNESELSKSLLLNWVISGKNSQIFFNKESEGYQENRQLAEGMIEVAWYLPINTKVEDDHFQDTQDIALFTNLRGNARNYPLQLKLINQISSKIVIFISTQELEQEADIIRNFLESGKAVIICISDKNVGDREKQLIRSFRNSLPQEHEDKIKLPQIQKNPQDIRDKIRKALRTLKTNEAFKISLETVAQSMLKLGMDVDEYEEICQKGITQAANILEIIQKYSNKDRRNKVIPLQGKLWFDWANADKEFQRMNDYKEWKRRQQHKNEKDDDETYKSQLKKRMKICRENQYAQVKNSDSEAMKLFLKVMLEESTLVKEYFIRYLKLKLDEFSRQEISNLRHLSEEKRIEIDEINKRIIEIIKTETPSEEISSEDKKHLEQQKINLEREQQSLFKQISDQSLGLEHFLREMGQIYEAYRAAENEKTEKLDRIEPSRLPKIAAELVLSGYPLEIMDGDVSSVPIVWVEAVFKELNQLLRDLNEQEEPKILTLSTLGIQSSGKSTLLNTMFGLQFAVSAGRCTRGVYLQPVKVENELRKKLNIDYIFVVDTEGLSSFSHGYEHDNELSTFVIGLTNITLILIKGENKKYLQDILPISVLAFLRMEQQGLQPKCKFVHQNVAETARKKLITEVGELQSLLDDKTQEACDIEKVSHRNFASIIDFDINRDVEYIPSLSEGSGAMAPVDPNYSQGVNTLKKRIIDENSSITKFSIDGFGEYLLEFWGAVKKDPFAYGFKDIIETQAEKVLRDANEDVTWVFKQDIMSHFISNARTSIGNCQSIAILDQTFEKLKQELKEVIVASYAKQESKLNSFFENPTKSYEKYITDRRHQTFEELENLSKELGRDANKKIKEFYEIQKTKINSIHLAVSFKDKIYQKIKDFVDSKKQNKKGDLSWTEAEQKNLFEEIWTSIIKETNSSFEALGEANVVSDAYDTLRDIYSKSLNILAKLVLSSNDLTKYYLPFDVQKSIDAYLSKQNFVGQVWGRLTELKEEEKKTIQCFLDELDKDIDIILETKKQSRDPYNKNDLTSILKSVQTKIEEKNKNLKKTKNFDIHIGIEVAFAVSVCGRAIKKLEIIDENFRNDNDPILNLQKDKNDYEQIFIALLDETKATVKTTTKLGDIILDGICERIDKVLLNRICDHIQSTTHPRILAHKNVLLARIMISLAEEEKFDQYITYIHSFETSLHFWLSRFFDESDSMSGGIRGLIENEINELIKSVKKILKDIKDATGIASWTEQFYEKANNKIGIKDLNQVNIMGSTIKDFDCEALQDDLIQRLEDARPELSNRFNDTFKEENYKSLRDRFVSEIRKDVIGCTETCPFCGEICQIKNSAHEANHSVLSHRPIGIIGYRPLYGEQKKLITSTCQQRVNSDGTFRDKNTNGQDIPFKDYYKIYPEWTIIKESGGEESTYWIWFMIKFSRQLTDYYKRFDDKIEEPDIPDYWKEMNLTKEQEIEKLKKIIEGR